VALGDQRPADVAPAAAVADGDGTPQPALRAAGGILGVQADAHLPAAQELLEARGGLDRVAVAAARGRAARVVGLLHRVDAGDPDREAAAAAVAVDIGVERVAVGDEGDLCGLDLALRTGRAQQAAARLRLGGGGGDRGGRDGQEQHGNESTHRVPEHGPGRIVAPPALSAGASAPDLAGACPTSDRPRRS
jgi:hypothetical protein